MRARPALGGVHEYDQRRHACGEWRPSSLASCHEAPSSSLSSTLLMSGAPEKAKPAIVTALPARARAGAGVVFDFTDSSVSPRISSGFKATPGAPGEIG